MANTRKVIAPDGTEYSVPSDLTVEEIRAVLSGWGVANIANATYRESDDAVRFVAPQGGNKG